MKAIIIILVAATCGCAMIDSAMAKKDNDRRQAYVSSHANLSPEIRQAILSGLYVIGMTEWDALASLDEPFKRNTSGNQFGSQDQWVYCRYQTGISQYCSNNFNFVYLYFTNGKLTSWQDSR